MTIHDLGRVREHLAAALVQEAGIGLNDIGPDVARALDSLVGDILRFVPSANLDELAERIDDNAKREANPHYAGSITIRAHLGHDIDFGNEMEGEHDSHYVSIDDVDLIDLQLRDRWKELAVWTARDGLLGEGDHNLIRDAEHFIASLETKQDRLDDEVAEEARKGPFAIILESPYAT